MNTEKKPCEDRILVERVSKTIRERGALWCTGKRELTRYIREYLDTRSAMISSGHPLGLGEDRVLAGWALIRLIAGAYKPSEIAEFDAERAIGRIRDRMPRAANPLRVQIAEGYATKAFPKVWEAFEEDLGFLPPRRAAILRDEALELVATLRDSRRPDSRPGKRPQETARDPNDTQIDDFLERFFGEPPKPSEEAPPPAAPKAPQSAPPASRKLPNGGILRRVV